MYEGLLILVKINFPEMKFHFLAVDDKINKLKRRVKNWRILELFYLSSYIFEISAQHWSTNSVNLENTNK